jgi:undecaprenyl diphosphate synthase
MALSLSNHLNPDWEKASDADLLAQLDPTRLPRHIAIIMDGNGRWANTRSLARVRGHSQGVESVRDCVRACGELGVEVLTLYAFSMENWKRPQSEINFLMRLLGKYLQNEVKELLDNNVRFDVIGRIGDLPEFVQQKAARLKKATENCTGLWLVLALSYGSRQEITDAVRTLAGRVAGGELAPEQIDEEAIHRELYTARWPDPDLLIRTSGEIRISNFLLWQIAYAEFHITPVLWPDFRRRDLYLAILDYQLRERRFGDAVDKSKSVAKKPRK